ncbi:MAG: anaerobic C4-dicarboxylate transporter [Terriglobia bacterium]
MLLWVELAVLLASIIIGARLGGMALGPMGGLGLLIFVFLFHLPPGSPPGTVLGMILAVITALSLMQAAGGLDYIIEVAERILRRNPARITFLAPLVTYLLILVSGTQHVIYALLPVIAEVARKAGIRPERPLSVSVIASQHGLVASPVSAATVALISGLAASKVGLPQIMMITIPSTFIGVLAGVLSVAFRGKELADDPEYQHRLAEGKVSPPAVRKEMTAKERTTAMASCAVFLAAIIAVVLIGLFPSLRPIYEKIGEGVTETGQVEMGRAVMIVMMAAAGAMLVLLRVDSEKAVKGSIMKGGLTAIICILGVSWMGSSFFEGNQTLIVAVISDLVRAQPWVYAVGLFTLSILLFSQAATIVTLVPVALALGLPVPLIVGAYPAVNGNFFLPTYGTVLAAVSFDQSGTTRIGKYLLNHSFMLPGLVTTATATVVASVLAQWLLK